MFYFSEILEIVKKHIYGKLPVHLPYENSDSSPNGQWLRSTTVGWWVGDEKLPFRYWKYFVTQWRNPYKPANIMNLLGLPSSKLTVRMENCPIIADLPRKVVIFHNYVSLSEGKCNEYLSQANCPLIFFPVIPLSSLFNYMKSLILCGHHPIKSG